MSSKITQAQLDANTTTYAIDDYRKFPERVSVLLDDLPLK